MRALSMPCPTSPVIRAMTIPCSKYGPNMITTRANLYLQTLIRPIQKHVSLTVIRTEATMRDGDNGSSDHKTRWVSDPHCPPTDGMRRETLYSTLKLGTISEYHPADEDDRCSARRSF